MTKWHDQLDFSAEISKIRAARPDAVYIFYPSRWGVQFLTQYSPAGLKKDVPLYSAFTVDAVSLTLQKDLALATYFDAFMRSDLPYPINKKMFDDLSQKRCVG